MTIYHTATIVCDICKTKIHIGYDGYWNSYKMLYTGWIVEDDDWACCDVCLEKIEWID